MFGLTRRAHRLQEANLLRQSEQQVLETYAEAATSMLRSAADVDIARANSAQLTEADIRRIVREEIAKAKVDAAETGF